MSLPNWHFFDIVCLFDNLIPGIFLQPSSIDFSFIKKFLYETVTRVLSTEQKGQVMQRFLSLLLSEGSEETKILSSQMLVNPMLRDALMNATKSTSVKGSAIVADADLRKFIKSLLKVVTSFGSKLTCELLQLINILLEHMGEDVIDYRKDLIKYIWSICKNDDMGTKYFGYLAASRFVAVFETPPKVSLQIYR